MLVSALVKALRSELPCEADLQRGPMSKSKVYLENCHAYDVEAIQRIIVDAFEYLDVRIPRETSVLLKPNVLSPHPPERHITTHPAVIEAMARLLLDNGNDIVIADSCGQPGGTENALEKSQIAALKTRLGNITVRPMEEYRSRAYSNPRNRFLREVHLPRILDDVECIINLPKLKSHMLVKLTAAVKNLFGCIPGGGKQQAHVMAPSAEEFAELLVELYEFIRPKILINMIDAVVGLDGFGPGTGGRPNPVGFIGLSADAVALDIACCGAIGLDPSLVHTIQLAVDRGLSSGQIETNKDLRPVRFRVPKPFPFRTFLFKHVSGLQRRKPMGITKKCKKCGVCAKVCPAKCIAMDGYPQWDYSKCIYCYCCHETCPHAAIRLKISLFV